MGSVFSVFKDPVRLSGFLVIADGGALPFALMFAAACEICRSPKASAYRGIATCNLGPALLATARRVTLAGGLVIAVMPGSVFVDGIVEPPRAA